MCLHALRGVERLKPPNVDLHDAHFVDELVDMLAMTLPRSRCAGQPGLVEAMFAGMLSSSSTSSMSLSASSDMIVAVRIVTTASTPGGEPVVSAAVAIG